MTTQEMIFDYLKVQGLVPEYDEDKDIRFKYQMRNFVVSNYPDDRQFLQIMMPFIFDVTAENRVAALEACNKINLSKKIVKAVVMGEGVFLMTEVLLDETPEPSRDGSPYARHAGRCAAEFLRYAARDVIRDIFCQTLAPPRKGRRERLFSESGFRNRFRDRRRPCTAAAGRRIGDGARNVPSGSLSPRNRPISRADSALARELRS